MRNTNKKGFTIVELVVVVAVIAILAAVMIPVFNGVIAKANLSADQKALHDMNTAIAMEGADTLEEAMAALEKHKINAENLIPVSAGYSFVWNDDTNKIELVEGVVDESVEEAKKNIAVAVNTADAFVEAVDSGLKYIKLEADVTIDRDVNFEGKNITLDLNGHTYNTAKSGNRSGVVYIREGGSLTVQNGTFNVRSLQNYGDLIIKSDVTINAMDTTGGGCIKNKTGNVVIEGGTFNINDYVEYGKGGAAVVENAGGNVTINGGNFKSNTMIYVVVNLSGEVTINGGTFEGIYGCVDAQGGSVTINGGTFKYTGSQGHHLYALDGTISYKESAVKFEGNTFDGGDVGDNGTGSIEKK